MKDLYMVTTENGSEFAFDDFKLVEQFIAPLKNGTFYFRKVAVLENKQEVEMFSNYEQNVNQQNQPQ